MAGLERPHAFQTVLRQKGIAEASMAIPEDVGRFRQGVPTVDELIAVPAMEAFPLPEADPAPALDRVNAQQLFTRFQLQTIASSRPRGQDPNLVDVECVGPLLEIPTEFDSLEHFVQFKRELATVYKARSEANGWTESFGVCKHPTCLSSCAPTFEYCLFHLPLDPQYDQQKFIQKCQMAVEGQECPIPCGLSVNRCAFHRISGKDSKP
jgi:hypothetical protein